MCYNRYAQYRVKEGRNYCIEIKRLRKRKGKKEKEDFIDEVTSDLSLENWVGFKYTDRGIKMT